MRLVPASNRSNPPAAFALILFLSPAVPLNAPAKSTPYAIFLKMHAMVVLHPHFVRAVP